MQIDTINGIPVLSDVGPSGGRVQYVKLVAVDGSGNVTPLQVNADGSIQVAIESSAADPVYVQTQDLTPDAAQVLASVASGYLEQPGSFSTTVTNPGTSAATYAVIATNANGDTPILQSVSLTTVPNALSGSAYVTGQWSLVPGATGYKLVKSTNGGASWVQVGATLGPGVRSLADTGQATSAYTPAAASPALPALPVSSAPLRVSVIQNSIAVAASTTSGQLLAANSSRNGVVISNTSTAGTLYLLYGSGAASATSCTYAIAPGGVWEMPSALVYTGPITGVWSATGGGAYGAEL